MLISATADFDHFGNKIEKTWPFFEKARKPELFLLAGDVYNHNAVENYGKLLDKLKELGWKCPIVACMGNHEAGDEDDITKEFGKKIKFLQEESTILKIGKKSIGIVGSVGVLDETTIFLIDNRMYDLQAERLAIVEKLLTELKVDVKILLTHYAPTYKTMVGEHSYIWSALGSEKMERVLKETGVDFAVHGHAQYGVPSAKVSGVPVYNVAISVNNRIVEIQCKD